MDVLAIVLACSLYPDDGLVRALVAFQSAGNPYFVGDLSTLNSKDGLKSVEDALRVADDIRAHGGQPAVGLLGIPLTWASRYGRAPAEFFDACTNVAIGTAALAEYHDLCSNDSARHSKNGSKARHREMRRRLESPTLRSCILSHFAADLGVKAEPAAILKAIASELPRDPQVDVTDPPPVRAGIFGGASDDGVPADAWTDGTTLMGAPSRLPATPPRHSDFASPTVPDRSLK